MLFKWQERSEREVLGLCVCLHRFPHRQERVLRILEDAVFCECVSHFILRDTSQRAVVYLDYTDFLSLSFSHTHTDLLQVHSST